MNARESLIRAQSEIVNTLAKQEEALASLYEVYAVVLPHDTAFWARLAREERGHANLFRSFAGTIERGGYLRNLRRFCRDQVEPLTNVTRNMATAARLPGMTRLSALADALALENSLAEMSFFQTVESEAPEFSVIAQHMRTATVEHINRLTAELNKTAGRLIKPLKD